MITPKHWFMIGCIAIASISASGCGHIDEDFELTDKQIEEKYGVSEGGGGIGMSGTGHAYYGGGCGGYRVGHNGHQYGRGYASHYDMSPTIFSASAPIEQQPPTGDSAARVRLAIARRDTAQKPENDDDLANRLPRRKLDTWGDYVAQEIARAKTLQRSP